MVRTSDCEDAENIRRYQGGDERGFTRLFRKYYPRVFRMLVFKGVPQAKAEDATAEVFMKLVDSLKTYRFEKPFQHFLHRVVRNKAYDYFRKKQMERFPPYMECMFAAEVDHFERLEIREIIDLCLQKIKNIDRRVIILYWLEGYTRRQMADLLHLPLGTVHSHLERGRPGFKKCVKREIA